EVSSHAVEILASPNIERMIVALGTANAHTQEQLRSGRSQRHGASAIIQHESNFRNLASSAVGLHQVAHELIVWRAIAHSLMNPSLQCGTTIGVGAHSQ